MAKKQDWIIGGILFAALVMFTIFFVLLLFGISSKSDVSITSGGKKVALIIFES